MMRTLLRFRIPAAILSALCFLAPQQGQAVNLVTWESANSLIDTTNYTGLAPRYWFANFANPTAVTGAPMDQNEVRNLPAWMHLETRPAYKGFADDGVTVDGTIRTGYSFTETGAGGGSSSIGGQPSFNTLTLPGGQTGISGEAVDTGSGLGTTSNMLAIRILAGAPPSFRMWVVTDNGTVSSPVSVNNYQDQIRMRVSLRGTTGPPAFGGDLDPSEAEAMPNGVRIGQTPVGHNGIADAWSFLLTDVNPDDIVFVRPTSNNPAVTSDKSFAAFAGIIIQPIPEPASLGMLATAGLGLAGLRRRLRVKK